MPKFDDQTLERLFGVEDAENERPERLKEYFYRNKAYDNLVSGLPIRILVGHKGVGKSALLRVAYLEDLAANKLAIWLQPNDLQKVATSGSTELLELIQEWKRGLTEKIFEKIAELVASTKTVEEAGIKGTVASLMRGLTALLAQKQQLVFDHISQETVNAFRETKSLIVYLDDLDRGWEARRQDILRISALLNTIRDLVGDKISLQFRLGLRSDVYFLVRTSDESTDKIERNVIWLTWTNHEILALMAKRIDTFFGRAVDEATLVRQNQKAIAQHFSEIIGERFEGAGKWSRAPMHRVLLSLTRNRPRDLIKLLYGAARHAFNSEHEIIETEDLQSTFEHYSGERLQDIINEFRSEFPEIRNLLYGMRPTVRERRTLDQYLFANDQLTKKLSNLIQQNRFAFTNNARVTPKSLAEFLYKIDFITARRDEDGQIIRRFFDQSRHLQNQFVDFGFKWEIHPAYRWALQPGDPKDIYNDVDLERDE